MGGSQLRLVYSVWPTTAEFTRAAKLANATNGSVASASANAADGTVAAPSARAYAIITGTAAKNALAPIHHRRRTPRELHFWTHSLDQAALSAPPRGNDEEW